MQQGGSGGGGRGGGGHQSQYEEMGGDPTDATSSDHMVSEPSEQLEEASPISYRPPAIGNSEELMRLGSGSGDDGGVRGGGNRWPRQETVALLKIRSDMDTVFRDASIKGPLWEDVSRKLEELGYKRSAKKCKEKFENVQKYYKRTKDGRTGRQDGKSYKFFTELEALHHITSVSTSLDVAPISVGIPIPVSSVRITPTTTAAMVPMPGSAPPPVSAPTPAPPITTTPFGISFSSNSSSSSQGYELGDEPSNMAGSSCKRKRSSSSSSKRMMGFIEDLMKQVMQKQEALQQVFLEAIEKREQDRMAREEGWKRQEMARLAREHQHIAQKRALASSRDAAIVSFLQKLTGQTMQLLTTNTIPPVPPPPIQMAVTVVPPPTPIPMADLPLHQKPSIPEQQQPKQTHLQQQQPQQKQSHLQQQQPPQQKQSHLQQQQPQQKQSHLQQQQQQPQPKLSHLQQQQPQPQQSHLQQQQQPQQKQSHLQQQQQQPQQLKQSHLQQQQQQQLQQKQSHLQQQQQQPPPPKHQNTEVVKYNQQPIPSSEAIIAIPEQKVAPQEIGGSESNGPASSRWPKAEVLALINIRSGLETRYQEAGPKGPLWEEISTAMNKMGYKRNPKRCKEKWENINKYYKKVKESNKKRPDDAKTCPYFHQLDALYRKKILGAGGSSSFSDQNKLEGEAPEPPQHQDPPSDAPPITQQHPTHDRSENKTGADVDVDVFGEGNGKGTSQKIL